MFAFLKNHPFAVEAFFKRSLVLTFAVAKEDFQPLIPTCLELDVFSDRWAFIAVALVETSGLRPKGFPRFFGNDFFLIGYRVFVRYTSIAGNRLRGLYILKSETDSRRMEFFGNIFTHYKYATTDIRQSENDGLLEIESKRSDFRIAIRTSEPADDALLPAGSPFADWREARGFAGPMPFTFTYNAAARKVLIIEGVRQHWMPRPVRVTDYHISFLQTLPLSTPPVLANAFVVEQIPYYWKKGADRAMERLRKPFQGVWNIVRFNWHFYVMSIGLFVVLLAMNRLLPQPLRVYTAVAAVLLMGTTLLSLFVSWYIYDLSGLYGMRWCGDCAAGSRIVNIHAGFDETSDLLQAKFAACDLIVLDFYDPQKHTELSIRRARKACPPFPGTQAMQTSRIPLANDSAHRIFVTLSAHEIRNDAERAVFFKELTRVMKPAAQIVVTEHLRDLPNFLAYTIGFFHFLPHVSWQKTFHEAGLKIAKEITPNLFITTFILEQDGTAT